ncbi:D-glucuronyl C5-epimerase family protein [Deinococcus alpinitundrae]|uniref:D-glucuronyl C5-epimerase family protein n=1 Tax=Deinococcus alpinitundrae TaxID=468913 RepID=UPI00137A70A9|nr:D-glucuronyl C5-epimerase family protein [Deinococcus alpinitundrae]
MKRLTLLLALVGTAAAAPLCQVTGNEKWPKWDMNTTAYPQEVKLGFGILKSFNQPSYYFAEKGGHTPTGDYMHFSFHRSYVNGPTVQLDDMGVPKIKYGDGFYFNPNTVAQYALGRWGRYLLATDPKIKEGFKVQFLDATEKMSRFQIEDGSFRYEFPFLNYEAGWVSSMMQGLAMSVYARAYELTKDPIYVKRGDTAMDFTLKSVKDGGVRTDLSDLDPSLAGYVWFEEYPNLPNMKQPNQWPGYSAVKTAYTLNGYMFTLVGINDWAKTTPTAATAANADEAFKCGISTLERIFPYYEIGGWTTYDLRQVYGAKPLTNYYHLVHTYLMRALRQATGNNPILQSYEERLLQDAAALDYKVPAAYDYVAKE